MAWSLTHTGEPGPKATPQPCDRLGSRLGFWVLGKVKVALSPEAMVLDGRVSVVPAAVLDTRAVLVKVVGAVGVVDAGGVVVAAVEAGADELLWLPPHALRARALTPTVSHAK